MADLTRWDVVVIGGANTDYLVVGKTLPQAGETVTGVSFQTAIGGKGVNQATAAARLRARVAYVGRVGNDERGDQIISGLDREGVDTSFITCTDHQPTGVALVMVDEKGEKQILVAPGANHDMRLSDIDRAAAAIKSAKVLLVQLEVPMPVVAAALKLAHDNEVTTVLDPAPPRPLTTAVLRTVDVIRPNAGEAQALTGIRSRNRSSAWRAAQALLRKGPRAAIVQAGSEGNILVYSDGERWLPHLRVRAVDSTGAGDAFAGALAAQLAAGADLETAAIFANAASALATTRIGAQVSLPTYEEVESLVKRKKTA